MGIVENGYNYLTRDVDKNVAIMMQEEANFISTIQHNILGSPYLSFSVFLHQVASVFLRLMRLVKNILLLSATLLLAIGMLFYDRAMARNLGFVAAGRVFLIALNLTSIALDLVSIVVNSLSMYKSLPDKEELEKNQSLFCEHIQNGFFKPIERTAQTTKMCFDEITADLGFW